MTLSLRSLKDLLITKGGYNISPDHSSLNSLKLLVNNMNTVRGEIPPGSGTGDNSGTTCGSFTDSPYNKSSISLKELYDVGNSLPNELCPSVKDSTCGCVNRTYASTCSGYSAGYCDCYNRTYAPTCECNTRTYSCSCNSNVPACDCNSRTPSGPCDCQNRVDGGGVSMCTSFSEEDIIPGNDCGLVVISCGTVNSNCSCQNRITNEPGWEFSTYYYCSCLNRTRQYECNCDARTITTDCTSRTYSCGSRNVNDTLCGSRTYAPTCSGDYYGDSCTCQNRTSTPTCICNGRCACNTERRFE